EDRQRFKDCMTAIGIDVPRSGIAHSLDEVMRTGQELGFPLILRPSFTLGGLGGGIAYNRQELEELGARALGYSPTHEVLIEESVLGWKEFELEVMRDKADNVVIICSIENVDPMGVHTGDSITVAPAQTLSDVEYQAMRDMARQVIRAIGVETGGSNIQFGVHPDTGRIVVIEMNPRVRRSSALGSMENRTDGLDSPLRRDGARAQYSAEELEQIRKEVKTPTPRRLFWLAEACRAGIAAQELYALSAIDPWFIREVQLLVDAEGQIADSAKGLRAGAHVPDLVRWKRLGFSDKRIGRLTGRTEADIA